MKKTFLLPILALAGAWLTTACSDDDSTLENASEVYIDIRPESIVMAVGDTVAISGSVSTPSGKIIETPIHWTLDDESVVNVLGDSALVCVAGALDRGSSDIYTTKLRATLVNGKYAVTTVTVRPAVPEGVTPDVETRSSYNISNDKVWFTVSPKSLLEDYVPVITLSNDNLTLLDEPLVIEKETGRVGVPFASGRTSGECVITLTIGEGSGAQSGSTKIVLQPDVESSIWDPGTGDGPNDLYIRRMAMGELAMYRTFALTKTIDINSVSYAYAGVNVNGGNEIDIRAAMDICHWEAVSGNSVLVTEMKNDFLEQLGFDAILRVASGAVEGNTVFNFVATDTILEVTFRVIDFKKQPVDRITTNAPEGGIEMVVGGEFDLQTGVEPATSFAYHRPVVVAEDPSIVEVGEYNANMLTLKALKEGKTNLVLTANDKTIKVPVTVNEGVSRIVFANDNVKAAFAGQTLNWLANVTTSSGKPSTFPISWASSDNAVASVAQGADPTTTGVITAKANGTAEITATVVDKSVTASIDVIAVPDDITYTPANTSNVAVANSGNNLRLLINGPNGETVQIFLAGYKNKYSFDVNDMSIVTMNYNGVEVAPESGWLKGQDLGSSTKFSFELTFSVAGKKFTLKATDLEG